MRRRESASESLSLASRTSCPPLASRLSAGPHHPQPVMPPGHANHECDWKDRYIALTAEVRQLKAEITGRRDEAVERAGGRPEGEGPERQDEYGIEGLTIVMHMKGKEDLIINTDLRNADAD